MQQLYVSTNCSLHETAIGSVLLTKQSRINLCYIWQSVAKYTV